MTTVSFKYLQRIQLPSPVNSPISDGDRVDVAINKLQGQINNIPNATQAFDYFVTNWSVAPTINSTVTSPNIGTVYNYTLNGVTRYRFVPDIYTPSQDAFYSTFSGGVLSGLIVSRG